MTLTKGEIQTWSAYNATIAYYNALYGMKEKPLSTDVHASSQATHIWIIKNRIRNSEFMRIFKETGMLIYESKIN